MAKKKAETKKATPKKIKYKITTEKSDVFRYDLNDDWVKHYEDKGFKVEVVD